MFYGQVSECQDVVMKLAYGVVAAGSSAHSRLAEVVRSPAAEEVSAGSRSSEVEARRTRHCTEVGVMVRYMIYEELSAC